KEMVLIEKSELDGRVVHVYPTKKGKEVIEASRRSVPSIFRLTYALEKMEERYSTAVVELFFECLSFLAQSLHGSEKVRWIQEGEDRIPNQRHLIS
ncbi:MAG TPA: MarR family transcriptional regulator, partial [Brevibacillus sp.]|nr:MarR family transcriptional regulator [Brevibacillus sp.]